MKSLPLFLFSTAIALAATPAATLPAAGKVSAETRALNGAWRHKDEPTRLMLIIDGYFSQTASDLPQKRFSRTMGGPFTLSGGMATGKIEFDSEEPRRAGEDFSAPVALSGGELVVGRGDSKDTWLRLDGGKGEVAGVWRLSGRESEGAIREIAPGPAQTLKILSGTRFQWLAFNAATGDFTGTGGGTYTFNDGKYTEVFEFYSPDNLWVGASTPFETEMKAGAWHQRGRSPKGAALHEVWSRR